MGNLCNRHQDEIIYLPNLNTPYLQYPHLDLPSNTSQPALKKKGFEPVIPINKQPLISFKHKYKKNILLTINSQIIRYILNFLPSEILVQNISIISKFFYYMVHSELDIKIINNVIVGTMIRDLNFLRIKSITICNSDNELFILTNWLFKYGQYLEELSLINFKIHEANPLFLSTLKNLKNLKFLLINDLIIDTSSKAFAEIFNLKIDYLYLRYRSNLGSFNTKIFKIPTSTKCKELTLNGFNLDINSLISLNSWIENNPSIEGFHLENFNLIHEVSDLYRSQILEQLSKKKTLKRITLSSKFTLNTINSYSNWQKRMFIKNSNIFEKIKIDSKNNSDLLNIVVNNLNTLKVKNLSLFGNESLMDFNLGSSLNESSELKCLEISSISNTGSKSIFKKIIFSNSQLIHVHLNLFKDVSSNPKFLNTKLTTFEYVRSTINQNLLSSMVEAQFTPALTKLNFKSSTIDNGSILLELIKKCTNLKEINLNSMVVSNIDSMDEIMYIIGDHPNLSKIDISSLKFTNKTMESIIEIFRNPHLVNVDITNSGGSTLDQTQTLKILERVAFLIKKHKTISNFYCRRLKGFKAYDNFGLEEIFNEVDNCKVHLY